MASLKDLIVEGSSRFLSNVFGDIIHANKFVTDNGTSSQFVKGDGTLDNNTYLTSSTTPQYTISKLTTAETGYIASYELKKDGTKVGDTINIPKDYLVKSGTVEEVTTPNTPYQGATVGDKYLDFVVNTYDTASGSGTTSHIYIPVNDLVDVYTEGNGINIDSSNIVSIKIDPTASNSNGLATTSSGLKLNTATQSSAGALSASDKTKLDGIASGAEVNVQSDWNQSDTTSDDYIKNKPTIPSSGDFVTSLGTSGNNVTWTKNGVTNNLTVPYATKADTATKLGTSTIGSTNKPIFLNSGIPTAITSIPGSLIKGSGINSMVNDASGVGINPAINGAGMNLAKGGSVELIIDNFKFKMSDTNPNYLDILFDGVNSTYFILFSPTSAIDVDYHTYSLSNTYSIGDIVIYKNTEDKVRWYRSKTNSNTGNLPTHETDNTYWEYVSGTGSYATGMNPQKFSSVSLLITLSDSSLASNESGLSIYWRTAGQHPKYLTVEKYSDANFTTLAGTCCTQQDMTGETVTSVYCGSVAASQGKYFKLIFEGFGNATSYWICVPTQIAFTGLTGGIEGTVVMRKGGSVSTMFGDFYPNDTETINLGTSSKKWNNVYAKKFIKSGGTSSQFLKADGSVDSNTYATTSQLPSLPLSIANGGTGKTTAEAAANALIGGLPQWTADPSDDVYLIRRDTGGSLTFGQVKFSTVWNYIKSKISSILGISSTTNGIPLAPTAASGTNTTQIATTAFVNTEISGKADKVSGATSGNFASLDSNGNITDSGHKHSDYLESNQGSANSGKAIVVGSDGSLSPGTPDLSKKAISIPSGQVDSTSTSTAFTATIDGITELGDGVCCYLKNGIVSSAENWTLNINNLGAKPVYNTISESSRIALGFESEYTMLFIYNSTRVSGGCWDMYYGSGGHLPVLSKVYENYTCAEANVDKGYIYFMQIIPTSDNYYDPWFIHYTLEITTDQATCQGYYDITLGSAGTTSQYCVFNKFYSTSYYPSYTHQMAWHNSAAKYANRETNPIRIGERIYSAYQAASRARTYKIKVLELHGCRLTFPESIETYDSFYSDANYGYNSGFNATSNGVIDNYDANTVPYQYYEYYTNYKIHDASTTLYRYRFVGFDNLNKLVPFTVFDRTSTTQNKILPISVPIIVSKGISYYSSTTNITTKTGRTGAATLYRSHACSNTPFYYNFNGLPPQNCTVYIIGSYDYLTDQFILDSSTLTSWYLCVPDSIEYESDLQKYFIEGNYYWLLGVVGSSTTVYGALYLDNPLYYFDGKSLLSTKDLLEQGNSIKSNWNNQIFTKRSIKAKNSVKASITKLRGLSLAWNQLAESYKVTNGTATTENGIVTIVPTNTSNRYILKTSSSADTTAPIINHLYLQTVIAKSSNNLAFINNSGGMIGHSSVFNFSSGDDFRLCYDYYRSTSNSATTLQIYSPTSDTFYIKDGSFMLFDLTMMFGPGCEPTAEKFFELFPKETYAYCAGTLINSYNEAETIKSYNANGTLVDSVTIPNGLNLKSSGFDHDEVFGTTKITRVGSVNLGDLTWVVESSSSKIFKCSGFSTTYGSDKAKGSTIYPGLLCGNGYSQRIVDNTVANLRNKELFLGSSSGDLYIRDTRYSSAADFKTAVNNVYITFSLATPIESTITDIGTIEYDCALGGSEEALQAYQSATSNTPTCTPFRCDLTYEQVSISNDKADKVTSATSGNFAGLDSSGNLTDSGHKHGDYVTALGTDGNNLTYTKNGTANNITVPFATTSSKVGSSTVGSTKNPIYLNNGTPTAVSNIDTNLLLEPARAGITKTTLPLVNTTAGNRLALLPPDQVIIEKTIDGGETWTSADISDYDKKILFCGTDSTTSIAIPKIDNTKNKLCGIRITITGMKYNVPNNTSETDKYNYWNSNYVLSTERYVSLEGLYIWLSSNTDTIRTRVYGATGANPDNWIAMDSYEDMYLTGWSGGNFVSLPRNNVFGGGTSQTGNYWNYRIICFTDGNNGGDLSTSSTTSTQSIHRIQGFGRNGWTLPNKLVGINHLYTWNSDGTMIIPTNVYPDSNNSRDLGSSTVKWRNIYGMNANIAGAITIGNLVFTGSYNSLSDKPVVYTKSEVDSLLNGISNFTYEVVNSLPAASSSTTGKMYVYNGHRYVTTVSGSTYTWVDLGSYDVSLVDYVTHDELDDELEYRPIHQKVTEIQMQTMLENETWEEGVIYYTVEES